MGMTLISLSSHNLSILASFWSPPYFGPHPGHDDTFHLLPAFSHTPYQSSKAPAAPACPHNGTILGIRFPLSSVWYHVRSCLPDKILETRRPDEILETLKRLSAMFFHIVSKVQGEGEEISWENTPDAPS